MINAAAVGKLLGLSARTIYDLHARGFLPGYRFGRALRFDPADVEAYRSSCRTAKTLARSVDRPPLARGAFKAATTTEDLAAYFRAHGVEPKMTPSTGRRGRTPQGTKQR